MLSHDLVIVGGATAGISVAASPSRLAWILKKNLLPPIYWDAMLKGVEWLASPKPLRDVDR